MTIQGIRFRTEGALCVLQVLERGDEGDYYGGRRREAAWRDASVTDLLDVAKFTSDYTALEGRLDGLTLRYTEAA